MNRLSIYIQYKFDIIN